MARPDFSSRRRPPEFVVRHRRRLFDLLLTGFVLWFTLAQYGSRGFGQFSEAATEPDGLGFALVLVTVLPLLVRRRHPWPVFVIAMAGNLALVALGYGVHAPAAAAVGLYTLVSRADRGALWPALAAAGAFFAALVAAEAIVFGFEPGNYVFVAVILAAGWLVGDRRRTMRQRGAEIRERRRREQRLTVAEERTRIARELHDSAGHAINTILVQAGAARVLRERDPERSAAAIEAIEKLARETIEDIDRIVASLRDDGPAELAPLPGLERIPDLVAHQRAAGLAVELHEQGDGRRQPPAAVGRAAYRIAQEALTNAARHGRGPVELTLRHGADALELTAVNPLGTAAPTRPGGGLGVVGMRERASLIGGSLEAAARDGRFRVHAVLPYDRRRE